MTSVFPTESPDGTMLCVNITIMDDNLIEGDELFTVTFAVPAILGLGNIDVTIMDDEGYLFAYCYPRSNLKRA